MSTSLTLGHTDILLFSVDLRHVRAHTLDVCVLCMSVFVPVMSVFPVVEWGNSQTHGGSPAIACSLSSCHSYTPCPYMFKRFITGRLSKAAHTRAANTQFRSTFITMAPLTHPSVVGEFRVVLRIDRWSFFFCFFRVDRPKSCSSIKSKKTARLCEENVSLIHASILVRLADGWFREINSQWPGKSHTRAPHAQPPTDTSRN